MCDKKNYPHINFDVICSCNKKIKQGMRERRRLENTQEETHESLSAVISFLEKQILDSESHYYYFEINPETNPITHIEIKALLSLPYECSLTEKNGKIIIETGTVHSAPGASNKEFQERMNRSRLSMHTHIISRTGKQAINTPSFSDIYVSFNVDPKTPLILAAPEGLIHYRQPNLHPITKAFTDKDPGDLMIIFCKNRGINLNGGVNNDLRSYFSLSDEEKITLQRDFAIATSAIIEIAPWENEEAIQRILRIINLQDHTE
jgi:hypothetical protein